MKISTASFQNISLHSMLFQICCRRTCLTTTFIRTYGKPFLSLISRGPYGAHLNVCFQRARDMPLLDTYFDRQTHPVKNGWMSVFLLLCYSSFTWECANTFDAIFCMTSRKEIGSKSTIVVGAVSCKCTSSVCKLDCFQKKVIDGIKTTEQFHPFGAIYL